MFVLLINFFLYLAFSLYVYSRSPKISIYHLAWLWFTLIAFMGCYAYSIGAYSTIFNDNGKFVIEPFIYCFVSVYLLLYPLKKFQSKYCVESYMVFDKERLKKLGYCLLIIATLRFLIMGTQMLSILSTTGLGDAYTNYHEYGSDALGLAEWQGKILWITQPIHNNLFWFVLLVALMSYNRKDAISTNWIIITIIFYGSEIMGYLSRSARGEIMYMVIKTILLLVLLWPRLRYSMKRKIILIGMISVALLFVYTVFITIDRFQYSDLNTQDGIIRYLGEPFPNLGNQLWGKVFRHPMGARFFPFIFGFDDHSIGSVADYQDFWTWIVGVPMLNFKTIYGDFYIEFGKIGGLLGIIILSLIWIVVLKNKNVKLYMIPIFSLYLHMITMAPLYFTYRGTGKYIQILWAVVFTFLLKALLYKKRNKRSI